MVLKQRSASETKSAVKAPTPSRQHSHLVLDDLDLWFQGLHLPPPPVSLGFHGFSWNFRSSHLAEQIVLLPQRPTVSTTAEIILGFYAYRGVPEAFGASGESL